MEALWLALATATADRLTLPPGRKERRQVGRRCSPASARLTGNGHEHEPVDSANELALAEELVQLAVQLAVRLAVQLPVVRLPVRRAARLVLAPPGPRVGGAEMTLAEDARQAAWLLDARAAQLELQKRRGSKRLEPALGPLQSLELHPVTAVGPRRVRAKEGLALDAAW